MFETEDGFEAKDTYGLKIVFICLWPDFRNPL